MMLESLKSVPLTSLSVYEPEIRVKSVKDAFNCFWNYFTKTQGNQHLSCQESFLAFLLVEELRIFCAQSDAFLPVCRFTN